MKKSLLFCFSIFLLACQEKNSTDLVSFDDFLENYYQENIKLYRINGTFQGDSRYNDTLPNFLSSSFEAKEKAFFQSYLNEVANYPDTLLSEEQQLSKKVLKWECEMYLQGIKFPKDLMPIDQMWGFQLTMGQLASGMGAQPFKTPQDYDNWLIRIEGYLSWLQSAKENMKEGMAVGWVLPTSLVHKVIPQLEVMSTTQWDEHLFYSPIRNLPEGFSEEERSRLSAAYAAMVQNKIIPAYADLVEFMSGEYFAASRESSGFNALPEGDAYYQYAIRLYTTTDMTAEEIHTLGLNEVARIQSEMEKIKDQVGFKGDLKAFFDHVRTLKELMPYTDAQQVIDRFYSIQERMLPQVNRLFELQPKTAFEVRRTEAFREASASAEYNQGSLDGTRPGIFYVPIPNVTEYNNFSDEDLFLHEAIPGHHFQISLQQENENLPSFRKDLWYSAYGEGWALYTESLGKELGLYEDPYQYFGMLGAEIHRAIRLVVDTGLHAKGWTREQAIQYSLDNEAESEASIISEVERYMANPGQALSYKVGQLKIRELRTLAETALGSDFDIKHFHRIVLESGCIPLSYLEDKIKNWISTETTSL
ncbi:MAG: DUF885 domain-containing protein [Flavobacteriaceae bacterium]|nr:DUF885 domain-containing protein [Flavobacteriia bacterium]